MRKDASHKKTVQTLIELPSTASVSESEKATETEAGDEKQFPGEPLTVLKLAEDNAENMSDGEIQPV